jgi:anthranilate synthase / indole-3-glycerol phosphate synthase / phosphoribosylanthranilate isomerase
MHQLQAYAAAFISIPNASPSLHLQVPNMSQQYHPHHISATSPQQPNLITNVHPSASQPSPPSPFFPTQSPSQGQAPNLLSLLFPGGSSPTMGTGPRGAGTGPSRSPASVSASGSSSVGSLSPQLDGSPLRNRGRQRTRIVSGDEGWVVSVGEEGLLEQNVLETDAIAETVDDVDVSEVLADAILKHPGSLRVRSKVVREQNPSPRTEFTFPTLSSDGGGLEKNDDDSTFWITGSATAKEAGSDVSPAQRQ